MSGLSELAPVLLAVAALAATGAGRRIHPATRARLVSVLVGAAGAATAAWSAVLAGGLLASGSTAGPLRLLAAHGGPAPLAVGAVVLLLGGLFQFLGFVGRARRGWALPQGFGVVVTDDPVPAAFAVRGRVVLSRGLLRCLDGPEVSVVVAHERSHLEHHHHRYVLAARIGACFAPWLRPLVRVVRFDLERWADEDAATVVADRGLVACTIAKVALATHQPDVRLAFGAGDVMRRVEALLCPPPRRVTAVDSIAMAGAHAAATGVVGTTLQLHHALHFLG